MPPPTIKQRLLRLVPQALKDWYAGRVKHYRTEQVVSTLKLAHAQELASAPGDMWPMIQERHVAQIHAVRDGKLDIVDRRTYQWPYLPMTIGRSSQPVIKYSPANIRRFATTPIPRRAINLIKNSVIALKWDIVPMEGELSETDPDTQARAKAVKFAFEHPNNFQSFQNYMEVAMDDFLTLGASYTEPGVTPDPRRPFKLWNVDSSTLRHYPDWKESTPNKPRFAQMMGLQQSKGGIPLLDSELMYIPDNPRVDTPFGLGKCEVGFEAIADFLGVQRSAGKAASDATHPVWLWWESGNQQQNLDIIRRHLQNDLEGQGRINTINGMKKPDIMTVPPVVDGELNLQWQEMLIRVIACAFDMSPLSLGTERDVNRSTAEQLSDNDFQSAVVPVAVRFASAFTTFIIHRTLGMHDLKFAYLGLEDPDITVRYQQQMMLMNVSGETANGMRKALGKPALTSPYADLTMFEQQMLMVEAQAKLQDANAAKAMTRQMAMMPPQSDGDEGGDGGAIESAAVANRFAQLSKLRPAKLPMLGCKLNALQVASMDVKQLRAAIAAGAVTSDPNQLADQMEQQEPGILLQLAQEVLEYLQQLQQLREAKKAKTTASQFDPVTVATQKKNFQKTLRNPPQSRLPGNNNVG